MGLGGTQKDSTKKQNKKTIKRQATCVEVTEIKRVKYMAYKNRAFEKPNGGHLREKREAAFGTEHRKRSPLQCCRWLHRRRP